MTKQEFKDAIEPAQALLDNLTNACNDVKSFLETAKILLADANPISQIVDQSQIDLSVQIVQSKVSELNNKIQQLDFSMFV